MNAIYNVQNAAKIPDLECNILINITIVNVAVLLLNAKASAHFLSVETKFGVSLEAVQQFTFCTQI